MIWAYLAVNVYAVLGTAYVRYDPSALSHAGPVAVGRSGWVWAIVVAEVLCICTAVLGLKRLTRRSGATRALVELMLLPASFVLVWGFLPPRTREYSAANWVAIASLLAAVGVAIWRDSRGPADLGLGARNFAAAARRLAIPTVVMVAVPIVTAMFVGTDFELHRAATSLAGYPVYALAQLLIFQVFLVPRLCRLSDSRGAVIVVASGLFALAHWPNMPVMCACAAVGAVWTWVYLARPNVYATALSMALAAVSFTHALPRDLTHHVRVGPMYVFRAVQHSASPGK